MQALALAAAVALAYNGARILNETPVALRENFDGGVLWLGLALLALMLAAWEPPLSVPKVSPLSWVRGLAGFWRAHWVEIVLIVLIFGFGLFMRLYRFGATLPPSDGLCCEEHINGNVAFKVLEGDRPLLFPLVRWSVVGGFLLFGETTLGLRFFFVVMGIGTLVLVYLLLRQLVSRPVALFGFALFAAAWWPALSNRRPSEGTIYAVLFALLLVRGMKTRSALMFLGAGVVAGLISYEYEAFKPVPIIAVAFLGAAAAREVLLRSEPGLEAAQERALELLKIAWRPALIFLMAAGIVLVPLAVGINNRDVLYAGRHPYFTSVDRNRADRGGALFIEEWPQQLKWAIEVFLPFGPKDYPATPPRDIAGTPLLDPLMSSLAVAGLITGAILFYRGFRLLFVSWFVLTLLAGALLLSNFAPWKFYGLVPIALVLGMLFVEDVRSAIERALGALGGRVLAGLLVLGAVFSFWWNADTLYNDVAPALADMEVYSGEHAQYYAYCDYLRSRGPDNYTIAFSRALPNLGFQRPRASIQQQLGAWGDLIWVCHDLDGRALPAAEEAWPLRDLPSGPTTLVFSGRVSWDELIEELNRVYPGLGEPDRRITGPDDNYEIIAYEFDSRQELARYGLWADYALPGGGAPALSRIDPVNDLSWEREGLPLTPPFTVRWRGVVYVKDEQAMTLGVGTQDPVEVRLDGQVVYSTTSGRPEASFADLLEGWHPVEITLEKRQPGGEVRLNWVLADEGRRDVQAQDLFPLADLGGWIHEQTLEIATTGERWVTQRLDVSPHYSSAGVVSYVEEREGQRPAVMEERWTGVWEVPEPGTYAINVEFLAGTVRVLLDGAPITTGTSGGHEAGAVVALEAGAHAVELVQELAGETVWSGAQLRMRLEVLPSTPHGLPEYVDVPIRVVPY